MLHLGSNTEKLVFSQIESRSGLVGSTGSSSHVLDNCLELVRIEIGKLLLEVCMGKKVAQSQPDQPLSRGSVVGNPV